jgi:hypothetical protein
MRRTLFLLGLSALLLQCKTTRPPLEGFRARSAHYGFKFSDSRAPQIQIVLSDRESDCESLDSLDESVTVTLSSIERGTYAILGVDVDTLSDAELFAWSRHELGDFRYTFAAGSFRLDSVVDPELEPQDLTGQLHVFAPLHPRETLECSSDGSGGSTCICRTEEGSRSSCKPRVPGEDCCAFLPKDHWEIEIDVRAEFCPLLCQASSPTLYSEYCGEISE